MNERTCILFFSRTSQAEASSKSFGSYLSKKQNKVVANRLIENGLAVIRSCNLPYVHYDENYQKEGSFGEKLASAVEFVIARGFENIILLGNDCPGIRKQDILKTKLMLEQGKDVVAPTKNGGVYLLGIRAVDFNAVEFAKLRWQSGECYNSIVDTCQSQSLFLLQEKQDLNNLYDFIQHCTEYERRWLILFGLIFYTSARDNDASEFVKSQEHNTYLYRGPPIIAV